VHGWSSKADLSRDARRLMERFAPPPAHRPQTQSRQGFQPGSAGPLIAPSHHDDGFDAESGAHLKASPALHRQTSRFSPMKIT
jgi:hypothetical protein